MMRKRIVVFIICFVSLCCVVGALLTYGAYIPNNSFLSEIYFTVKSSGSSQDIKIWHDQSHKCYYAFLPSYTALDSVSIDGWPDRYLLAMGKQNMVHGQALSDFSLNTEYAVTLTRPDNQIIERSSLVIMRSGNIPAMHITTESGRLEHIHSDKSNKVSGYMTLYTADAEAVFSGNLQYIKGRGNTSWREDKKSYKFKLSKESDLLGLGSASVWVLQANAKDDSYLQNKITFDIANQIGLDSSDSDFIDLYVNGEYIGNYLLCEQPEIGRNRVDITGLVTLPGGDISGGYLLEVCDGEIVTDSGNDFDVKDPDQIANRQLKYISDFLQEAEDAVLSPDGYNPMTGKHYAEYIDLGSLVNKYLILEFSKSYEGGRTSDYFYTDIGAISPLLYSGPVWDFDSAYGFPGEGGTLYSSPLGITRIALSSSRLNWYSYLYKKQDFLDSAKSVFYAEFVPVIQQILDHFTVYEDTIRPSAALDQVRWGKDPNRFMDRC